ncbi:MAG: hypothetical protein J1E43_02380 [Christensenellaceae bacterium]|nr:hypothetical protein [Christensenellaceae bacterium]
MRKGMMGLLLAAIMLLCAAASAEEPYTMTGFDGASGHEWTTSLFFERMEERTGLAFSLTQYTNSDRWTSAKAAMLSGEQALPDALFKAELTTRETMDFYEAGMLIDLRPYLEEHAPNLWALLQSHPEWEKAITLPNGAIVALPSINEMQNNNAMWINQAWLSALHLEMPTTPEELKQVLIAFRDGDPNRNGRKDEVPLSFISMWDLRFLAHAFGIVSNDYYVYVDESGTVREVLTLDQQRAFLEWLHELWEENLIDHNGFLIASSSRQITDSDAAITYGMMFAPTPLSVVPSSALDQYALLMPMTYEGEQRYRDLGGDIIRGAFAVSSACKNPAAMLEWVDFLYSEEGYRLAQAGMVDVDYIWNDDGTWNWLLDDQTVAMTVLPQVNMTEGGFMPGWSSESFQLAYSDRQTREAIEAMQRLKQVSVEPYPLVYLTAEQQERISEIQLSLGRYVEKTMAWFVTGDMELNDGSWEAFCRTVEQLDLSEMVGIWQTALNETP